MKQKSNLARCYVVSLSKIDAVEEYISSLIQNKQENEFVDFKQFYYHENKKYDLIKDIVSFSNEVTSVDKDNIAVFKKEKANIEHYFNIGAYVRLIEDFESDLYEGAVVPIALAQKYTAISLQPGGKILDVLAQTAIKQ